MIVYAADIHLTDKQPVNRITSVLPQGIDKFKSILQVASDQKAAVILGGDLFESPCPSYALYNQVVTALRHYGVQVYAVFGNHDLLYGDLATENNALRALCNSKYVTELSIWPVEIDGYAVYGISYKKELYTEFVVEDPKAIIVTHQFLTPKPLPYGHVLIQDFNPGKAKFVFCAHLHTPFTEVNKNGTIFVNPGCVCRINRNEADVIPSYVSLSNGSVKRISLGDYPVSFSEREVKKADFIHSISDAKVESQDVYRYIENSSEPKEVKACAVTLIKKYKGETYA